MDKLKADAGGGMSTDGVAACDVTPAMREAGVRVLLESKPGEVWEDRIAAAYRAMGAAAGVMAAEAPRVVVQWGSAIGKTESMPTAGVAGEPPDPCPQCERGGVCKTPTCGRLQSSELMRLYGIIGAAGVVGCDSCPGNDCESCDGSPAAGVKEDQRG